MALVPPMGGPGSFWRGSDGNVYVAGSAGTNSAGAWDDNTQKYWSDRRYQMVNDPTASQVLGDSTPAPTQTSSATGPVAPILNRASIDNTQTAIDQLPTILESALQAERARYNNTTGDFNAQEQGQRKVYDQSTVTNQQNYDANFMDSIRAGIKGVGGLLSLLRGTGAGGGTAEDAAREAVGSVAANDIRTGADTQKENQTSLDGSMSTFLTDLSRRRRMNEDTLVNNERAIRRDTNTQLQDLFGKMAGFYGDAGDNGAATSWMNRAGSLTPEIAANSRTQVSNYDTAPITVKAPELNAFAAPTQPSVVTTPNGQVGSGIFTMSDNRRRKEQAQTTPTGV